MHDGSFFDALRMHYLVCPIFLERECKQQYQFQFIRLAAWLTVPVPVPYRGVAARIFDNRTNELRAHNYVYIRNDFRLESFTRRDPRQHRAIRCRGPSAWVAEARVVLSTHGKKIVLPSASQKHQAHESCVPCRSDRVGTDDVQSPVSIPYAVVGVPRFQQPGAATRRNTMLLGIQTSEDTQA